MSKTKIVVIDENKELVKEIEEMFLQMVYGRTQLDQECQEQSRLTL